MGEPFPDFLDSGKWSKIKVLRQKSKDPHGAANYQFQHATTRAAYGLVGVKTSRATHGGRHAGILEAESEGLDQGNLARMGRWCHDKMTVYYLSGLAIPGAFASAGFHNEPYVLERDCEQPPVELQRLIFPWIEAQYPENPKWADECDDIMNGIERSGTRIANDILADQSMSSDSRQVPTHSQTQVAKYSLLHLLLHLRRVILQDAAMFINAGGHDTPLMRHSIFRSTLFLTFMNRLLEKTREAPGPIRQFEDVVPDLVKALESHHRDTADILRRVSQQQDLDSKQLRLQGNRQQIDHESIRSLIQKQDDYNKILHSRLSTLLQNQQQMVLRQRRQVLMAMSALAPEPIELPGDLLSQPTNVTAAAMTNTARSESGSVVGCTLGPTTTATTSAAGAATTLALTEPFKFSRTADTIQAVVSEFDRLHYIQEHDKRLGYPTLEAYRTEYRYINNRQTIIRELTYLMDSQKFGRSETIAIIQETLDRSGMKIAAFQKVLRDRQKKRDEETRAQSKAGNNQLEIDGNSDINSL